MHIPSGNNCSANVGGKFKERKDEYLGQSNVKVKDNIFYFNVRLPLILIFSLLKFSPKIC